jgi:hypothetical protein
MPVKDSDPGFRKLLRRLRKIETEASGIKVGVFSAKSGSEEVIKAAANEFGVPSVHGSGLRAGKGHTVSIPERSYLRSTYDEIINRVFRTIKREQKNIISGKLRARDFWSKTGVYFVKKIQGKIRNGSFAPNAPSTIKGKGSSKPLIDTGRLRQEITYSITKKRGTDELIR